MFKEKIKVSNIQDNVYYQNNPQNFVELLNLVNDSNQLSKKLKTTKSYLAQWINEVLPKLSNDTFLLMTKLYWIFNNITDFPTCQNNKCNKLLDDINVISLKIGYKRFCCHKCAVNSDEVKEKAKQTCLKKYGTISPGQAASVKEKSKQTCLKKYGVEYSFKSESTKEKAKQTCLKKYGTEYATRTKEVQDKIRKTKEDKYGENQPWHSKEALETRKKNCIKKYGVDSVTKLSAVKEKKKQTCLKKYGKEYISQNLDFIYNAKKTIFNRIILNNLYDEPLFTFDDFFNREDGNVEFEFKCKKCGNIFKSIHVNGVHKKCPLCYPTILKSYSEDEKRLAEFLQSLLQIQIRVNVRDIISPYELDIYIPEKNLAIEYDGMYWHSDEYKGKNYHLMKTTLCKKLNIQLIHVFENEWLYKQDIVKSRLKNLLGIYNKTIFARKCEIRQIDNSISSQFQNDNHIQGAVNANINLGLFYGNELISLMAFGKTRFNKNYEYELLRFCNKLGYHVPGAAGKLLKYFERNYNPKSLVSYADRRWSQGKLYEALGFTLDHIAPPNYWYFKTNTDVLILESRVKYQKHKLKDILEKFDECKSEVQNMIDNGYHRIFDCGNLVYVKTYV